MRFFTLSIIWKPLTANSFGRKLSIIDKNNSRPGESGDLICIRESAVGVIADAGLPTLPGTARIDLALTKEVPGAVQTLKVVPEEIKVEKMILAEEVKDRNPASLAEVRELLPGVPIEFVTHSELKSRTADARAVVRTTNGILQ